MQGQLYAAYNQDLVVVTPAVANWALWTDFDYNARFPNGPNFGYGWYSPVDLSQGWVNSGTMGSGRWTAPTYNQRLRRRLLGYTNGLQRWEAYNPTGTTGTNLTYGGAASDTRFLSDGSGYIAYFVITRRTTTGANRLIHTCTASTANGILVTGQNGQQRFSYQIGNGSAQAANQQTTGTSLPTDTPCLVTVKVTAYAGIGSVALTIRITTPSGDTTFTSTNWLAAPATGTDPATTLKLLDTWVGDCGAVLIYKASDIAIALGDANDLAIKAALTTRFIATPNTFVAPKYGQLVLQGNSETEGSSGGTIPWRELLGFQIPVDMTSFATAGKEVGPPATAGTMTNFSQMAFLTGAYDATRPFNWLWWWGATNDIFNSRSASDILSDTQGAVTTLKTTGYDKILVANMMDRGSITAAKQTQRGLFNAGLSSLTGIDGVFDAVGTQGPDLEPWVTYPGNWASQLHLTNSGNQWMVNPVSCQYDAFVP